MIYIGKTVFAAVIAAAVLMLATLAAAAPAEVLATPTPTATATVPPPTPSATATAISPTATPTFTAVAPTPTPTATAAASPHIDFNPALMSFTATLGGADSPEKVLLIRNVGSGNLRWTVSATFPWIGLFPDAGTCSAGDVKTVAVWIDPEGLSVGTHTGQIMISSVDADNSPQWVYVSVDISEEEVVATATPRATPTASPETQPSATPSATPTPTPAEAGGGLPTWVWPVVGVLAVLVLAFGIILLHPARLWGKLKGLFPRGGGEEAAEGLTTEEMYEDTYGDEGGQGAEGGEPPEDYD